MAAGPREADVGVACAGGRGHSGPQRQSLAFLCFHGPHFISEHLDPIILEHQRKTKCLLVWRFQRHVCGLERGPDTQAVDVEGNQTQIGVCVCLSV